MTIEDNEGYILKKLIDAKGYVSGESLSLDLGISRTAVWKEIEKLRDKGYRIESTSRKGYLLEERPDLINELEVGSYLRSRLIGSKLIYSTTVDSTNNLAKKLASEGAEDGTVVLAEEQTAGKGRLGRAWSSQKGAGIWMSIILRPDLPPEKVPFITLLAGLSVTQALDELGFPCMIKWPNDVILSNKKVCGILTEMSAEVEKVNFIVAGIGLNVLQQEFAPELADKAISLLKAAGDECRDNQLPARARIAALILEKLENNYYLYINGQESVIIDEYQKKCITLGRTVRILDPHGEILGTGEAVTSDGRLVVICSDGTRREITSGEVSVRGLLGYV